ncbi:hypothetical protein BCR34DRAFT_569995 [Clohesyomyces aquaticus]|uniref:Uncharacterized protein n=1 Tax=Clohesyomyces aquaticus TaxID=1231657 RepID=A0A1Y1ZEV2_9PLEO|nr:hypothetical protein BCR34DRAFT_569995 [Clohesyomyces aquaticus]
MGFCSALGSIHRRWWRDVGLEPRGLYDHVRLSLECRQSCFPSHRCRLHHPSADDGR